MAPRSHSKRPLPDPRHAREQPSEERAAPFLQRIQVGRTVLKPKAWPAKSRHLTAGLFSGEDAKLPGACHCFRAIGDVKLAVNVRGVSLDGARSYDELPGNLTIGLAQCDEVEDF